MLYRASRSEDWQEVAFEKIGPWNVGNILVPGLRLGEYTLAVKENSVGIGGTDQMRHRVLEIFPNPSSDTFHIITRAEEKGELKIYNEKGQLVNSFMVNAGEQEISWVPAGIAPGAYLVILTGKGKSEPLMEKVILLR
jgi:hypothetical protein